MIVRSVGLLATAAFGLATIGCADDGPDGVGAATAVTTTAVDEVPTTDATSTAAATPVAPTGVVVEVASMDNTFRPEVLEIEVGTAVVWTNVGRIDHDIIPADRLAGDPDWGVDAADFGPGAVHQHVFLEPGEYPYYCSIHGTAAVGMIGTVIVTEPTGGSS